MSGDTTADGVDEIWDDWLDSVNMTAKELTDWLDTPRSKAVGDKSGGEESTGHESGRRIVALLGTSKADLGQDDAAHMRRVVGYIHRHLGQRPSGDVTETPWRH